jgi:23S rRNA pseudouridine2605 synthase
MRVNKFVALATGMSRRTADATIEQGRVSLNATPANAGQQVNQGDKVTLDGSLLSLPKFKTIILNKPVGYVCSRTGQGSRTIYDLIPTELHNLKPAGRLDKDSSGLLLLTNNGDLANRLTHPSFNKEKVYIVMLNKPLTAEEVKNISVSGISLKDGVSKLKLHNLSDSRREWQVTMNEGRNRQIRRTFAYLGYEVISLQRIRLGNVSLTGLDSGKYKELKESDTI